MEQSVSYTWMESPTGRLLLAADDAGLRFLLFVNGRESVAPRPHWREDPTALRETVRQFVQDAEKTATLIREAKAGVSTVAGR